MSKCNATTWGKGNETCTDHLHLHTPLIDSDFKNRSMLRTFVCYLICGTVYGKNLVKIQHGTANGSLGRSVCVVLLLLSCWMSSQRLWHHTSASVRTAVSQHAPGWATTMTNPGFQQNTEGWSWTRRKRLGVGIETDSRSWRAGLARRRERLNDCTQRD